MKKIRFYALIAVFLILGISACKKEETEPERQAPTMSGISIEGENKAFDITVNFSTGVYKNNDQTGDLNENKFNVAMAGGDATISTYSVLHVAGQKSATIKITTDNYANGEEQVTDFSI